MTGYFVVGTDTGVGKTLVSCMLLRNFAGQGLRAVGMKPVAAGCEEVDGKRISEDVTLLRSAANLDAPMALVNPYAFAPPVAPHIAAAKAGVVISLPGIVTAFAQLQELADVVIVEGVGGFRVPLNDTEDTADLAQALRLPVILVVGLRLGCINHALLTVEAIRRRGLALAGWVANCIDPHMDASAENLEALKKLIGAPLIGNISYEKERRIRDKFVLPDVLLLPADAQDQAQN